MYRSSGFVTKIMYDFKSKEGPKITYSLIGACIVVWLLQIVSSDALTNAWQFNPLLAVDEPWRYLTYAFLHSTQPLSFSSIPSPLHLAMNMWTLYMVGPMLERMLGHAKFAIVYFMSAIGGGLALTLWTATFGGDSYFIATVGASGAVFGLFGAMLILYRKLGVNMRPILGVLAINLAFPLFVGGIAWQSHVGGVLVGILMGYIFMHIAPKFAFKNRNMWIILSVVVFVALSVIILLTNHVIVSRIIY
jgi:membrane associated rhomboid family serine protease